MSDRIFVTPTDISSFSYCEIKWEFDRKYRSLTRDQILGKLKSLESRPKPLNEAESAELEFLRRMVKRAEILDRGEREHSDYSKKISSADLYLKAGIILIIFSMLSLLVYLLFLI